MFSIASAWAWTQTIGGVLLILLALLVIVDKFLELRKKKVWSAKGKVVVITGASSGIGEELARQYAAAGSRVALCARRVETLVYLRDECMRLGAQDALIAKCDVGIKSDAVDFVRAIKQKFGVIDCLILNAGISMAESFETVETAALEKVMQTNYFGCVYITQAAIPLLRSACAKGVGARICLISSGAGKVGVAMRTGYCASKAAVNLLFEALHLEFVAQNLPITISTVCPGPVNTNISNVRLGRDQSRFDPSKAMSAADCATIVMRVIREGKREELFNLVSRVGFNFLKPLFPNIMEVMLLKELERLGYMRPPSEQESGEQKTH